MAFINLLQAMYPVGSIYLSTTSTSPSSTIGGTWTQVKGATLAATGANSFAGGASYGGSLKVNANQLPSHTHKVYMHNPETGAYWNAAFAGGGGAAQINYAWKGSTNATDGLVARENTGGGKTICLTTGVATFGIELLNITSFQGGDLVWLL